MTAEGFDDLMSHVGAPMAIVTTVADDGERSGCLVGFHGQCSIDPPRYGTWISEANHTHGVAQRAEVFAVHLLSTAERHLAELFGGQTGDEIDKFEHCSWVEGPGGVPLLDGPPARVVGVRRQLLRPDGDHTCVIIEPESVEWDGRREWLTLPDVIDIDPGHPVEGSA